MTVMNGMFLNASGFNQNIDSWDTSNVTNMNSIFRLASSFNQDISGWNMDKVTSHTDFSTDSALTLENSPVWNVLVLDSNGITVKYTGAALTSVPTFVYEDPMSTRNIIG
jgi:surface protein